MSRINIEYTKNLSKTDIRDILRGVPRILKKYSIGLYWTDTDTNSRANDFVDLFDHNQEYWETKRSPDSISTVCLVNESLFRLSPDPSNLSKFILRSRLLSLLLDELIRLEVVVPSKSKVPSWLSDLIDAASTVVTVLYRTVPYTRFPTISTLCCTASSSLKSHAVPSPSCGPPEWLSAAFRQQSLRVSFS